MLDDIVFGMSARTMATRRRARCCAAFDSGGDGGRGIRPRRGPAMDVSRDAVRGVRLANGAVIETSSVVNAAGPWAGRVAALAGVDVPVEPMRPMLFRATLPRHWPHRFRW